MSQNKGLRAWFPGWAGSRNVPIWIIGCFLISSCTSFPQSAPSDTTIDLSTSYAVKNLQELNKDPRAYYHYLMALKAEQDYQFEDAAGHYREVIRHDNQVAEFHQHLASHLLRAGKFDEVLKACDKGLQYFPDNVFLNMMTGNILSARGENERALNHYQRVIEKDSSRFKAYLLRGAVFENMGQYDSAREMYQQVVLGEPTNPMGHYFVARILARLGDFEEAEKGLKEAVSVRPSLIKARELLAWTLQKQGKLDEAVKEYRVLLKLDPENKRFLNYLAGIVKPRDPIHDRFGSPRKEIVLEDILRPVEVHTDIGIIYFQQAMYLQALDEFQLAQARERRPEIHFILAKIYETLGRIDRAIAEYVTIKGEKKGSVALLIYLARLYSLNDQTQQSVDLLRDAVRMEPGNDTLYHSLALAYMALQKYDQAIQNMRQAVSLNPDKDSYYFELGALLERTGEYEGAIGSMKRVIELNPMHSNAHNFIGYMYAIRGEQLDKALDHLKKAISIQPRNGYFLDSLGWIYFKKGDPQRALAEIKKAMIYTSPDPVLYSHLGDIQFSLKNYIEATRAWRTSLSLTRSKKQDFEGEVPDLRNLEEKIQKAGKMLREN